MIRGLLGKKIGMTQIFDKDGNVVPVTVVEAGPCTVLEVKEAPQKRVKLGFSPLKEKHARKSALGYFKKVGVSPLKYEKEFDSANNEGYKVGQEIKADFFKAGDYVDVSGTSIGRGFAGGVKRHGWAGGPDSHGSMHHRHIGSIGSCASPSKTIKGMRMPGRMGGERVTTQGLRVMGVDAEQNLIWVKGAVPGHANGILEIRRSFKKIFKPLDEQKLTIKRKVNPMKQSKQRAGAAAKKK